MRARFFLVAIFACAACGGGEPAKKPAKSAVTVPPPGTDNSANDSPPTRAMAPEPMKIPECRADSADTEVAKREFQIALEEFEKGNYKLAAEGFTRAYVRSCSAPVLYNLGMTYEKLGDSSGALEAYDLYLKKQTNNAHVDEVKQRIEALRGKTR